MQLTKDPMTAAPPQSALPSSPAPRRIRCLVTAGNTREMIDSVRDWGNIFTGNTGLTIARALSRFADVELLTSNARHVEAITAEGVPCLRAAAFRSQDDLRLLLQDRVSRSSAGNEHRDKSGVDAVLMSAAIADYRPVRTYAIRSREKLPDGTERWIVSDVQAAKIKSSWDRIAVEGERTEKLVDLFRNKWGFTGMLVKFKLEVGVSREKLVQIASASRVQSDADLIVANTLDMVDGVAATPGTGFGAGAFLIDAGGEQWVGRAELAQQLAERVRMWWASRCGTTPGVRPGGAPT